MSEGVPAVAKLTVSMFIDAENLRNAEKMLDVWLSGATWDPGLVAYRVDRSSWVHPDEVPRDDATEFRGSEVGV